MNPLSVAHRPRPVVLCILDGWGWRPDGLDNAIFQAKTPNWDVIWAQNPKGYLNASEDYVGLPDGQMGNSEVGHLNIGAGRVVRQELPRIDYAIKTREIDSNPALLGMISALKSTGGTAHLFGLVSPGGVHSHQNHLIALCQILNQHGIKVAIHAQTDGRDVPPQSALAQLASVSTAIAGLPHVTIATLGGRYYGMDRDKRWERVEKSYDALVNAVGEHAPDAATAIQQSYDANTHDEFILPTVIGNYDGMKDGDAILCFNYRADRARQMLTALLEPDFNGFTRPRRVAFSSAVAMTEYSSRLSELMGVMFPPESLTQGLGELVAAQGWKQLRAAETEKYPHVTFFLNGGREEPFEGEDRLLIPSPKVATYDLQPEMSAPELTNRLVDAIDSGKYDLIIVNYANPDMVGHTGILSAAIAAVEAVDDALGKLQAAIERQGGAMLITADHGNCEMMNDMTTHGPHTAHTLNLVPVVLIGAENTVTSLSPEPGFTPGRLADVAPTLLAVMGLPQPAVMTGRSLLQRSEATNSLNPHGQSSAA